MKRLLTMLLAAAMLLSLAACAPNNNPTDPTAAPAVTNGTEPGTLPAYPEAANPVIFISLSLSMNPQDNRSITVLANADGSAHVEYVGKVKKVGDLDANIFHGITTALENSGLAALNGQDAYADGIANGSMFAEFADGTCIGAGFSGEIPDSYTQGYAVMDDFFSQLTASMPVYVPQPVVMGNVDPMLLGEVTAIVEAGGLENPDTFTISHVEKDEYFAYTLGLSSGEGIQSAVSFAPMMMTTAYSLVIVSLENAGDRQDICSDFLQNLDWQKWVCVAPTDAMIAAKDNMVLCLMAADALYDQTAAGVKAAGWTVLKVAENR